VAAAAHQALAAHHRAAGGALRLWQRRQRPGRRRQCLQRGRLAVARAQQCDSECVQRVAQRRVAQRRHDAKQEKHAAGPARLEAAVQRPQQLRVARALHRGAGARRRGRQLRRGARLEGDSDSRGAVLAAQRNSRLVAHERLLHQLLVHGGRQQQRLERQRRTARQQALENVLQQQRLNRFSAVQRR
jgi:hypothetical protein